MKEIPVKKITAPLTEETVKSLQTGDQVLISGIIYTARDMVHEQLVDILKNRRKLPFNIEGSVIYYVGPSPAPPGMVIGSAGPTTSYKMDPFVLPLLKEELKCMIGKGSRSQNVVDIIKNTAQSTSGQPGERRHLYPHPLWKPKLLRLTNSELRLCGDLKLRICL